jgi:hypothetical protein
MRIVKKNGILRKKRRISGLIILGLLIGIPLYLFGILLYVEGYMENIKLTPLPE